MSSYYHQQPTPTPASPANFNPYSQYNASYAQYFPTYHPQPPPRVPTPPPPPEPSSPDLTSITPRVASQAIQRLIAFEMREAGFSGGDTRAMETLERDVVAFIERLYERAHQYANLSNRSGAIATDLVLACEEFGIAPEKLRPTRAKLAKKKKKRLLPHTPTLIPARSRSPSPTRLPSDDESVPTMVPPTLRTLPTFFPTLPPKHTYLRTPASPPKKAAIPSLEKKLETAALVQKSLKNLMVSTADAEGQEEGELLGHIVNAETSIHPRKRWKLSHPSSRKTRYSARNFVG